MKRTQGKKLKQKHGKQNKTTSHTTQPTENKQKEKGTQTQTTNTKGT